MAGIVDDVLNGGQNNSDSGSSDYFQTLSSIDKNLKKLLDVANGFGSQSAAHDWNVDSNNPGSSNHQGPMGQHHANFNRNRRRGRGFTDEFERMLFDSLGGSQFKEQLKGSLNRFASTLGVDVEDLGSELGKQFGKLAANSVKKSKLGSIINSHLESMTNKIFTDGENSINDILAEMKQKLENGEDIDLGFLGSKLKNIDLGSFGNIVKGAGSKVLGAVNKVTFGLGGPLIAMKALEVAGKSAADILGGLSSIAGVLTKAGNRYYESRQKNLEAAQKRLEADIDTLIRQPFDILKKAAEEVYAAWNANIRLIAGTQGYDKADLQDLMSAYASRIQKEGLVNVVPVTDVYNNLAKVIQSGLSGNAAVEFAYQATKYNAAIPNQDFFGFVDSYSSIAANAIAAGKSEAEALQIANQSLEDFSNSLLYASRNLVGGYSTGLKSAESIYASAVKIAQAARSENINTIASSLLAIQGYVGSIAPDLANNLSDKIYQLATGGNNADIVALRSLAGINASNTEFLRAFSQNPQAILSNMFANLGAMCTQSPDAYMEKAEGYASLFGLSPEAFQRIDFMSLANAINNMSSNSNTLDENMKLLKEGQSTTNADQLKIAQINKYMIEEGLAYVIDNEAAQMIQQHMWEEQIARELQETTYGVEIVGTVAMAVEKIVAAIQRIVNFLNPFAWGSKIADVIKSIDDGNDLQADIKQVLELGVVGEGNRADLYNLTTRNRNLQLTKSLVELMGGVSKYQNSIWYSKGYETFHKFGNPLTSLVDAGKQISAFYKNSTTPEDFARTNVSSKLPTSRYSGFASKNTAMLSLAMLRSGLSEDVSHGVVSAATGVISASIASVREKLNEMLSEEYLVNQYVKQGKSYEEWAQSAKNFGISDLNTSLTQAGYDQASIENYFRDKQTEEGMAEKLAIAEEEKKFRQTGIGFWETRFWEEYNTPLTNLMNSTISRIDTMIMLHTEWRDVQIEKLQTILDNTSNIIDNQINWKDYFDTTWVETLWKTDFVGESGLFTRFFDEFVKKFIEHTYYDASGYKYEDVVAVQRKEKSEQGDAVYALAEALTGNLVDLKDPQVQTNALLAQILVVVSAIMNQNNNVAGTTSLADALSSLAVGLTTTTPLNETPGITATT